MIRVHYNPSTNVVTTITKSGTLICDDPFIEVSDDTQVEIGDTVNPANSTVDRFGWYDRLLLKKKTQKLAQINQWREEALNAGVEFNGHVFDSDERSRQNLTGVVGAVNAGIPLPEGFVWRSAANVNVPMTTPELVALAATMLQHVNAQYARSWQRKAELQAQDNSDLVDLIQW